ncbi:hypothetical protein VNI00_000144 [Paramarasmius palmivorus]|uniref:F-box domain-containing protein n=1 Tax=Paramarasmius palmivorus TaxID=297713 RepID=A0AAW0EC02_9AGAR
MPHCDLPYEVWLCVAEFIPEEELNRLRSVSRHFYNIALQIKYRKVELVEYSKSTKGLLKDLKIPDHGHLVRSVRVKPWIIPSAVKLSTSRAKLWHKFNTFIDAEYPSRRACAHLQRKLSKHISLVSDTIKNLPRAQEYRIEWSHTSSYHPEFFAAFLAPLLVGTDFGQNITSFSVQVPVEKLSCLARVSLPSLRNLELQLHTGSMLMGEVNDHLDALVVFVNNTFSTLRSLSVTSTSESEHLDLNRFFHLLGFFPRLTAFSLSTPYDGAHQAGGVTPLETFIRKHSGQLEKLRLKCSRACFFTNDTPNANLWVQRILTDIAGGDINVNDDAGGGPSVDYGLGSTSLTSELQHPLSPISPTSPTSFVFSTTSTLAEAYPRLEVLEIPMRPIKHTLYPLLACLRSVGANLKSLVLTEKTLKAEEVEFIMNALALAGQSYEAPSHGSFIGTTSSRFTSSTRACPPSPTTFPTLKLRHLSMRILTLAPRVIESLAATVPNLKTLELDLMDVGKVTGQAFVDAMQHRRYEHWSLRTLILRNDTLMLPYARRGGDAWLSSVERAMRNSVPALEEVRESLL